MRLTELLKKQLIGRLYDDYGHAGYNDYIKYADGVIVDYDSFKDYNSMLIFLTNNYKKLVIY